MQNGLYVYKIFPSNFFISILLAFSANKKLLDHFFFKKIKKNKKLQKIDSNNCEHLS